MWTHQAPTQSGYYWIRYANRDGFSSPDIAFFDIEDQAILRVYGIDREQFYACTKLQFWSDPLILPPC